MIIERDNIIALDDIFCMTEDLEQNITWKGPRFKLMGQIHTITHAHRRHEFLFDCVWHLDNLK
jgi:hypothetical protein